MRQLFQRPFVRWLFTVPLYDGFIWLLCTGALPGCLAGLILPLLVGGLFLLGLIGGALWGGLTGLRWRTFAAFSLASLLIFPISYLFLSVQEPELFYFTFLTLNGQQGVGFALGAWCRILSVRAGER